PDRRRGHARATVDAGVVSGRRQHLRAGRAVQRRPGNLTFRHPVAVAGSRRARAVAVPGADRPHSVPAARRPATGRAAARGGRAPRARPACAGWSPPPAARRPPDRGVFAVLASRMAPAGYGGYLRASLPPFWQTTNPTQVRGALERLRTASEPA